MILGKLLNLSGTKLSHLKTGGNTRPYFMSHSWKLNLLMTHVGACHTVNAQLFYSLSLWFCNLEVGERGLDCRVVRSSSTLPKLQQKCVRGDQGPTPEFCRSPSLLWTLSFVLLGAEGHWASSISRVRPGYRVGDVLGGEGNPREKNAGAKAPGAWVPEPLPRGCN